MFFSSNKPFDPDRFEDELRKLSAQISKADHSLRAWQDSKNHYKTAVPVYLVSAYILYVAYEYSAGNLQDTRVKLHIAAIPFVIYTVWYLMNTTFDYVIERKQARLDGLKERHAEKLELLKEKTNFDRTKTLLMRYSNGEDLEQLEKDAQESELKKQEYLRQITANENATGNAPKVGGGGGGGGSGGLLSSLMGEDELSPDNRYALICSNCLQHNGLAPPGQTPDEVRYICPRCGFVNGKVPLSLPEPSADQKKMESILKEEQEELAADEAAIRDKSTGETIGDTLPGAAPAK